MSDEIPPPPAGYVPVDPGEGYMGHNGPYFTNPEGEGAQRAFYALPRHANGLGVVHGGMLTTFMDSVLAGAAYRATGRISVTIHLSVDFVHMARLNDWVMGEGRVVRVTPDVVFVEGRAYVRRRDVVRASGIFKLMGRVR